MGAEWHQDGESDVRPSGGRHGKPHRRLSGDRILFFLVLLALVHLVMGGMCIVIGEIDVYPSLEIAHFTGIHTDSLRHEGSRAIALFGPSRECGQHWKMGARK